MSFPSSRRPSPPLVAMVCAAAVSGQFIAGKATRDALFLSYLDVTLLPTIVIATSAFSILLVALSSKMLVRLTPGTFVPMAFACKRRLPSARVAAHADRARGGGLRRLSADLGPRADARLGFLADRHRAIRPAHGAAAVRPDRRGRHAWRAGWARSSPSAWPRCSASSAHASAACHAST